MALVLTFALLGLMKPVLSIAYFSRRLDPSNRRARHIEFKAVRRATEKGGAVTVVASIYEPGDDLAPFLENLSELREFGICEIILVMVRPTEVELEIARLWAHENSNVDLFCCENRATIYEVWNFAIENSSAPLITNANVDDRKNPDLITRQTQFMAARPDLAVAYTDYNESYWASDESPGSLQLVSTTKQTVRELLFKGNQAHASPIWRRNLHYEVGAFDEEFQSAGDRDFWLRCLLAGFEFDRIPGPPGYTYFRNPNGLSTKKRNLNRFEWGQILQVHSWKIVRHMRHNK